MSYRIGSVVCLLALCVGGGFPAMAGEGGHGDGDVIPILAGRCLECHGSFGQGGLDLRSRATAFESRSGAAIIPGDAAGSLLFQYVANHEMPPNEPLSPSEIETIRRWIDGGAHLPEEPIDPFAVTTERRAGYDWWSLQPLTRPEPPVPAEHPVDAFVEARLAEAGLAFSPPAAPRELIRRVTYGLTGLPPSPEAVEAFVSACREETGSADLVGDEAYRRLVDGLLETQAYGEHWARHWLDVVRYGESNGYERNVLFDNIWPYRDYVIRSIIDDKPFSRMIIEHLAADAVAPGDPETEVGMTFLVCGPFDDVGNQDPALAAQIRADNVDEMVRTATEAFLGLTVGCARCHDHKFDPVSIEDYYRLFSTFSGVYPGDREVATAAQREERAAQIAPHVAARDEAEGARAGLENEIIARAAAREPSYEAEWTRPPVSRQLTEERFETVEARYVRLVVEGRDDNPHAVTGFFIDEFEVWSAEDPERNVAAAENGGTADGVSVTPGDFGEAYLPSLTIDGRFDARWLARGPELTIALAQPERINRVTFSSDRHGAIAPDAPETLFVSDYRILVSADGEDWTEAASGRDRQPTNEAHRRKRLYALESTAEEQAQLAAHVAARTAAQAAIDGVPGFPVLRVGRLEQPPPEQPVFLGGDPQRHGDPVVPASLGTLDGTVPGYALPPDAPEQDRRLALARWIVHKDNPLPPRVLANRIWHYHFGTGIVASPSDFGFMGQPPSHPELLEWLASELVQPGWHPDGGGYTLPDRIRKAWRLKRMHRIILLSRTYRQSNAWNGEAGAIDGESRLLWRFPPRRLQAEEIRDSLLQIAGQLETRFGGPGFRLYEYLSDNVSTYVPLDRHGPETYRRAIYHQQARAMHIDLVSDFDAPDCAFSIARRSDTTTPLQALTLFNHAFTTDMAEAFAEALAADGEGSLRDQIARAYLAVFGRPARPEEVDRAEELAAAYGMRAFARALFNANEFLYLN